MMTSSATQTRAIDFPNWQSIGRAVSTLPTESFDGVAIILYDFFDGFRSEPFKLTLPLIILLHCCFKSCARINPMAVE
ncbi:MAG: hypothetical protein ACI88A_004920 [Paraglaciecola sp.]|jgi:hypothetical protein